MRSAATALHYCRIGSNLNCNEELPSKEDKPKDSEEEIKTDEAGTESGFHTPEISKKENGTDFSLEKLHQ